MSTDVIDRQVCEPVTANAKSFRLIVFDFDGTLGDSFTWFLDVINQVARRHRFNEVDLRDVEHLRGLTSREVIAKLAVPRWRLPAIARHMRSLMAEEIHRIRLFPEIVDVLRGLSQGQVAMALVSSNSTTNVKQVLGNEMTALFQFFECGSSLFGKAARLRKVLRRSGISAAETILIADEQRDLAAARELGMATAGVCWGYNSAECLRREHPDFLFHSPREMLGLLGLHSSGCNDS